MAEAIRITWRISYRIFRNEIRKRSGRLCNIFIVCSNRAHYIGERRKRGKKKGEKRKGGLSFLIMWFR